MGNARTQTTAQKTTLIINLETDMGRLRYLAHAEAGMRRLGSAVSATMPTTGIRAAAEPQELSGGESPQRGNFQPIAPTDDKLVRRGDGEFHEPVSTAYCNTERKLVRQPFATVQAVERSPKHRHFGGQHPYRRRLHRKC